MKKFTFFFAAIFVSISLSCTGYLSMKHSVQLRGTLRTTSSELEGVCFTASVADLIYSINDTITFSYDVTNFQNDTIYVISPHFRYWKVGVKGLWDSLTCNYIYDLGGLYYFNPGYNSEMEIVGLARGETFHYNFKFVVTEEPRNGECISGLNFEWKDLPNVRSQSIWVYTSFIPSSNDLKLRRNVSGLMDFSNFESARFFESHLRRINLGPLWFRMKYFKTK